MKGGDYNMRYMVALAVLGVILAGAGQAMAVPVAVDEGSGVLLGNSWSMTGIQEGNCGWFNEMRFQIDYSGATPKELFEGDWHQVAFNGNTLVIKGSNTTALYPLTLNFTGNPAPLEFRWQAFENGVLVDNCNVQYNYPVTGAIGGLPGLWTYTIPENSLSIDVPGVPEPLTMAGLFMGICGVVGYARKRRMA